MSSSDSDSPPSLPIPEKKRRIQRACDICRQKRKGCDGLRALNKKCTYCDENGLECVYSGAPTTTKRKNHTEILEARLAAAEKLVQKLSAEAGHSSPSLSTTSWSQNSPVIKKPAAPSMGPGVELAALSIRSMTEVATPHGDDLAHVQVVEAFRKITMDGQKHGFMGKSSEAILMHAAIKLREEYIETRTKWNNRRAEYWDRTAYLQPESPPHYIFPPPDALADLISLYFEHSNACLPLLHRPTFERAFADGLHLRDKKFGANLLLMCAIASRFSNDPRVFDASKPLKCGWKYFEQVSPSFNGLLFAPATLYDIQYYCLAVQFLDGSAARGAYSLIGIGLRLIQEAGRHRQSAQGRPSVESELWTRAFWILVYYDRMLSCAQGRTCALDYDDFDIDLPTDCDDEYWEPVDPEQAFRQPPGTPSRVTFFISLLRVNNILGFSLKMLYSLNKTKAKLALRDDAWEEHLVAELDSALNKWVEDIPEHLRWDPNRADPTFFRQSVVLYCHYYHVQMTIHRPFIPMLRKAPPTALPSLAICTNAARSCSHVAEVWCQRTGSTPVIVLLPVIATAGIVLSLNVWSGKRTGLQPHMNTTIAEVHKCMRAIQICEERWQMAGILWDVLHLLTSVGDAPPSQTNTDSGDCTQATNYKNPHKRRRDEHEHETDEHHGHYIQALEGDGPAQFQYGMGPPLDASSSFAWVGAPTPTYPLPTYSTDLGRLPVFSQANFQSYVSGGGVHPGALYNQTPRTANQVTWRPFTDSDGTSSSSSPRAIARADSASPFNFVADAVHGLSAEDIVNLIDTDALAMWANAPMTLGVNDWGSYFGITDSEGHTGS